MRKYKHIIFDIDGTLIDTEEAILQSLQDTVHEILHKDIEKVRTEICSWNTGKHDFAYIRYNGHRTCQQQME